jgi:hypothetical protein
MMAVWWVVTLAACAGLYFAVRIGATKRREQREVVPEVSAEIARRADQQNRWAQRGDARAVYGAEGAELMRSVDPEPNIGAELEKPTDYPKTAAVASTPADLATLLAKKLPCWRWAAFASVLAQRRAEVQSRLRDDQLGYGAPSGERAGSGAEVGCFVIDRTDELLVLVNQVESFMLTPAFVDVFGEPGNESSANADGIVHTAHRLMDYHERFLGLVERCRGLATPSDYERLLRDLAQLMDVPVAAYRAFIDDFVERVGEMPEMLYFARGTVELDPVVLHMDVDDDKLLTRITKQLSKIATD